MLTSFNRHLVEGFINWCVENGLRPFISVAVKEPGFSCSQAGMYDPIMPLNLSVQSCGRLEFAPHMLIVDTAFNGKRETVFIPYTAIVLLHTPDAEIEVPFIDDATTRYQLQIPTINMEGWVATGEPVVKPKVAPAEKPKAKVSHLKVVK